MLGLADNGELVGRYSARECHVIHLAFARNFHLEPFRERVDAFGANTMQAARILVGALPELAPCVQICQNQLYGGHFPLGMHVYWNASAVVANRYGSIDMNGYFDVIAKSRQMLVD